MELIVTMDEENTMNARNLYLLGLLAVPLFAQSPAQSPAQALDAPALPAAAKAIEVIPGDDVKVKYHFVAVGKQIYECQNGAWTKRSTPDATLYDMNSNLKIRHGAGPSWTMVDDKSTVRAVSPTAIHFAAPDGVSIDWLKLDVDTASRTGVFSDVGIVQRVYTGPGKAHTTGCGTNQVYESAYTPTITSGFQSRCPERFRRTIVTIVGSGAHRACLERKLRRSTG
jgi:hypothetical protein